MKTLRRVPAVALAFVIGASVLLVPRPAAASEEGRRNTALGLGAAAAALLLTQRDKTPGIVAGIGAALALGRYNDSVKSRHERERYGWYDHRRGDRWDRNDRRDRWDRDDRRDRWDRWDRDHRSDRDRWDRDDRGGRDRDAHARR
ncbi:MAG: hypothetical protein IT208_13440 [Chthonomonadales bacterium]|nr:hypothetical protein [Chthonomonadales bacterium]